MYILFFKLCRLTRHFQYTYLLEVSENKIIHKIINERDFFTNVVNYEISLKKDL